MKVDQNDYLVCQSMLVEERSVLSGQITAIKHNLVSVGKTCGGNPVDFMVNGVCYSDDAQLLDA
jgi:hypothetical protein